MIDDELHKWLPAPDSAAARRFAVAMFSFAAVFSILAGVNANPYLGFVSAVLLAPTAWLLLRKRWPAQAPTHEAEIFQAGGSSNVTSSREFDALPLPAVLVDADGWLIAANQAANAAFGELQNGLNIFLRFRSPEMRKSFSDALRATAPVHFEMHDKVPFERWLRVDICPVESANAKPSSVMILFRDVSEGRRIDRMRADFVANASHELRTPLASLAGFIETLKGPARSDEKARDRFLGIMQEQAGRMSRLIDDLLSLSRLETRSLTDDAQRIDFTLILDEVIDALQPVASEGSVSIIKDYDRSPTWVFGIRDELMQVADNLLENACKYGRSGGKVEVSLRRKPVQFAHEILFSVRDFGPGIAPEHIPRLTERFYRAGTHANPALKGTGLGLAIVKHIVSRHRGRLLIQSTVGEGSVFTVVLPELAPVENSNKKSN